MCVNIPLQCILVNGQNDSTLSLDILYASFARIGVWYVWQILEMVHMIDKNKISDIAALG